MFCKNCGTQLPPDAKFCNKCGANLDGVASAMQQGYKAPNFEFKTVRCYPDDTTETKFKNFYEDCGWQIMDMDRKQVFERQDYEGTKHYSTQTHIKMQRDKNHPNYAKIKQLSDTAEIYFGSSAPKKSLLSKEKPKIGICIICFMFYIFPLFIYLAVINKRNKETEKRNIAIREENRQIETDFAKERVEANNAREECKRLVSNS